jgi:hypothetical protein
LQPLGFFSGFSELQEASNVFQAWNSPEELYWWKKQNVNATASFNVQWVLVSNSRLIQTGQTVKSLVARSSRGRCTQHLRPIRRCDAHPAWILRESRIHANVTRKICIFDVRHVARVSCKCCAHLLRVERTTRDVTFGLLCIMNWLWIWIHDFQS